MAEIIGNEVYLLRRKVFKLAGAVFKIFDEQGELCYYVKQKAFKLREEIRVYADEAMKDEVLLIKAKKVIDFSSTYDVIDSKTNQKLGALKRRGVKSIVKDEWIILNSQDAEIGKIKKDSMGLALVRRLLTNLVPQSFDGLIGDMKVLEFKQKFNPFIFKMTINLCVTDLIDKRVGISAAILLAAIEGRQN